MAAEEPTTPDALLQAMGRKAREASAFLKTAPTAAKNAALARAAERTRAEAPAILEANAEDRTRAATAGLGPSQTDRLTLNPARVEAMAQALETIRRLPDPVGAVMESWIAPAGMRIERARVPLGVIGIIYESRPNVTLDAAALCLKSGNACLLRPGSESFATSRLLAELFGQALAESGLPEACVQMIPTPDRAAVGALLRLRDYVDVIVPRGGKSLVARVQEESRVPVLAHLEGNCHVYVDGASRLDMARAIVLNAKMRRTGICGAAETLLVDEACAATHLPALVKTLLEAGCAVRGDTATQAVDPRVTAATAADWDTEYLDAIIAVKTVRGVREAIAHIERHGSHHTDAIVTESEDAAALFLNEVDSAIVAHNASTQFADGGEFGMGAEIGIATGRLHARGPVGLEQLTTFKYRILGTGQTRAG